MAKKSNYHHPGGVIAIPRRMIRSDAYKDLSSNARALMILLQDVWRPFEPAVHYSVRRAGDGLNVSRNTAAMAFRELADHGFITCVEQSDWLNGRARVYKLTWISQNGREPSNNWLKWENKS